MARGTGNRVTGADVITETTVRLASKLYEMRDGAKMLLGDRYLERMAEFRKVIEIVQAKKKLDTLKAAMDICQHVDSGGFEVIFVMAAACEMIEPSSDPATADKL